MKVHDCILYLQQTPKSTQISAASVNVILRQKGYSTNGLHLVLHETHDKRCSAARLIAITIKYFLTEMYF